MRTSPLITLPLVLAAAIAARSAVAVDVLPLPHTVVQPDGTAIELLPRGDEFNIFWELPSGHTVVRDAAGWWRIATLDTAGRLVPGGPVAGAAAAVGTLRALPTRLRPRAIGSGDGELAPIPFGSRAPTPRALAAGGEQQPLLVILVQFTNRAPVGATAAQFASHFFTAGSSVKSYYDANLFGRLAVTPVADSHGTAGDGIVGWLPLAMNHPNRGISGSKTATEAQKNQAKNETRKAIKAAIEAADPYVDFAAFDRNGDGALSVWELAVTVIFAGYESSYGGYSTTYSPANWGHRWSLGFSDAIGYVGPAVVDGVEVGGSGSAGGYTTFGEWMQSSASNGHKATLGIMVHELGHDILSLPDLYDIDSDNGDSAGVGGWCLMAGGSWGSQGGGEWIGDTPTGLSAWSKLVTGVLDPVELSGTGSATATPAATSPAVFRLGTGVPHEYFLLEYRAPVGFDAGLKRWDGAFASAGGGLLVLHVDDRVDGNGDAAHKRVDVEEADAGTLGYSRLDLDEADAARAMLYYAGGNERFADDTNPSALRYGGAPSGVVVSDVGAAEAAGISFSYQAPNPAGYTADSCATALPVTLAPGTPRPISEDPSQAATSPLPRLCTAVSGLAWYLVEPARSGLLTVETSGYDTVAAVLRGSCDALAVAACNDDGVAAGGGSRIANLKVTRGEPVYVVIGRWGTSVVGTLSGTMTLSPGAPLQVSALASGGCPRAALSVQVSDGSGPLDGLAAASFTVQVDGLAATPHSFAAMGGGRYDLELWLEGGGAAGHAIRVEVDGDGAAGDLEVTLAEGGTACAGIAAPAETLVIPMAAHLAGSQGTNWRTDVTTSLAGDGAAPADLEIAYLEHGAANPEPRRVVGVEAPGGRGIADIAAASFGVSGGKGALLVRWQKGGAARLRLASRTYNLLGAGNALGLPAGSTFGQEVPAVPLASAVQPGATAWITGLAQRTGVARTNVGMVAVGDAGAAVTLDFFATSGSPLLTWSRTLRAWEYLQVDKILQGVAGGVDAASVRIRTTADSAPLVAYASVVDDVTGDPVTLLPVTNPATDWFVPMAANLTGLADTNWRSDLAVANPGDLEASVAVTFLQENRDNGTTTAAAPFTVPARGCVRLSDVVKTLFARSGVKGAMRVVADQPVVVSSRTYNLLLAGNSLGLPAGATFGQGVAGIAAAAAIDAAHPGQIPGVVRSADFRSNLGLLDVSGQGCSVTVSFRDAANAALGTAVVRTLRQYEYVQLNNVLASAGVSGDVAAATAEITVAGDGAVAAYLSVIDARTGDPITVLAER
jgi:M6 family metalloprotease-like protein